MYYDCLMNIYTKFYLATVFQSYDMGPLLRILKRLLQVIKSLKRDNINKFCLLESDGCVF